MKNKQIIALLLSVLLILNCSVDVFAVNEGTAGNTTKNNVVVVSTEDADEENDDTALEEQGAIPEVEVEYIEISINSEDDFVKFARSCSLDTWSYDKKVLLKADLDMSKCEEFTAVPTFGGYFDGCGHTIDGVVIKGNDSYTGLFNYTQKSATVTNLIVKGIVYPNGKPLAVGGIAGDNYGIISNCSFDGTVIGNTYTGAIAGFNETAGVIYACNAKGIVRGKYYTGGIAGENAGGISGCSNEAYVNTINSDESMGMDDINLDKYKESILSWLNNGSSKKTEGDVFSSGPVDTGGIAGYNMGSIMSSNNSGSIGYEHVGYNTGGIAGRNSGYVYQCDNGAVILGRKDVGGIVGQAEPYVSMNLTEDIVYQLTTNVNRLHDLIGTTLNDADGSSDVISMRLGLMQNFADKALNDTNYLADSGIAWVDGTMSAANEALSRIDYVVDETAKSGGVFDQAKSAATNTKSAMNNFNKVVADLDIYSYMSDEERVRYEDAKNGLQQIAEEFEGYTDEVVNAYWYLYIDSLKNDASKEYHGDETDLLPQNADGTTASWPTIKTYGNYIGFSGIAHYDDMGNIIEEFEQEGGAREESDHIISDDADTMMANNAAEIENDAKDYANYQYSLNHGGNTYEGDVAKYADVMASIVLTHVDEMSESASTDAKAAVSNLKSAAGNLENAGAEIKRIATNLSERPDIVMPMLGEEFSQRASSLNSNLQGVSDNLGYLNGEMHAASETLIGDLQDVNDQFNVIMLLFTDAIDGALEEDYTTILEDESVNVAEECVDGTIADCINKGNIEADIDTGGIVGTMAIEYDFDLESDITGFDSSSINTTYQTKCVLRNNINRGDIISKKSYVGGITGLQELGTILRNHNYSKVFSESGDYVGGIAGQSLARIEGSSSRVILKGGSYVGGIAGLGDDIYECVSLPYVSSADNFYGGIAGYIDDGGRLKSNYFCSELLAGIDRISYSGKAEPLPYNEFMMIYNVPDDFNKVRVSFLIDDEEVYSAEYPYGKKLTLEEYPEYELSEDEYLKWDIESVSFLKNDMEIKASVTRHMLTIGSEMLRKNGQSAVLVDGEFIDTDVLDAQITDVKAVPYDNVVEVWRVNIPDDGCSSHQIRYRQPENTGGNIKVYSKIGDSWVETDTNLMGQYILFDLVGYSVCFVVTCEPSFMDEYGMYVYIGAGVLAIIVALISAMLIIKSVKKKKHGQKKSNKGKIVEEITEENKESSNNTEDDSELEFVDITED